MVDKTFNQVQNKPKSKGSRTSPQNYEQDKLFSQVVLALLPPPPQQLRPIVKKVAENKELDTCKLAVVLVR